MMLYEYIEQSIYHKKLKTMFSSGFATKLNKVAGMSHVLLQLLTEQDGSVDNAPDLYSVEGKFESRLGH